MWGERESLTANDNDLISVSLGLTLSPHVSRPFPLSSSSFIPPVPYSPMRGTFP